MKLRSGFTIIELLVTISIIAVLTSVVLATLSNTRSRARDASRFIAINQIRYAMELYFSKCGTYIVKQNCTGTAYGSSGFGWFNYASYAGSAGSVAQGLVDNGVASNIIIDPTGMITTNSVDRSGFMIAASATQYTVWMNLENPTAENISTQNSCKLNTYDSYLSTNPVASQMNYCISN